ncbi:aminoglycoside phosphotransferase family protein [Paenibacillus hemerocallicola]|uniref:Aminoglycoside phosphotransferase family protein n=1 Tax=Paenibacillus hemerocallicola TaxID=1172614 RepID=A0A5C4T5T3_9BACL|nr:aminoglycoside phosphotransferase family protein [Paenibacillus hemerocallicola]TNJ64422.1 aminoglycoside phosphotransferase family protein [Paenibacillus hemerocallicola]
MLQKYVQKILEAYPDLFIHSVTLNENGQNNTVIEVNNTLIFRFPKYQQGIADLQAETRLLQFVDKHITLDIPKPIYLNLESQVVGDVFVGYRMIPGRCFDMKTFHAIKRIDLRVIARQLSTFLIELHRIPLQGEFIDRLHQNNPYKYWEDMYKRIQNKLFRHMSNEGQLRVRKHFEHFLNEHFLNNALNFQYEPTFVHGDFGTSNILIEHTLPKVAGVIDFGGAHIGDPAIDAAAIMSGYGESFLRLMYESYPGLGSAQSRTNFYIGTFALQEALFGIENNDEQAFKNGISNYQ